MSVRPEVTGEGAERAVPVAEGGAAGNPRPVAGTAGRAVLLGPAALCVAVGLGAAGAAAAGVFLRGDGAAATATSVRGEVIPVVTGGVYAHNAVRVVAEGVGWDIVTLVLVAPVLVGVAPGVARASLRSRLVAVGICAYLFYQYLMYAVFWALGPLFPVFITLYAASAVAAVWLVSTIDVAALPRRVADSFPRRSMAVFCCAMALLLLGMWGGRIAAGVAGDLEAARLEGATTLAVQALDLGMIVPAALATAVLVWRRRPWGYLMATVLAVKGVAMSAAICAMVVVAGAVEGHLEGAPLAIFGVAFVATGLLSRRMLASVDGAAGLAAPAGTDQPVHPATRAIIHQNARPLR